MRDIKFRAFHKENEEMVYFNPEKLLQDQYQAAALCSLMVSDESGHLMQSTGLQDKNGKDIYEGDLLMVKDSRICEVVFHSCAGCWDLTPRNIISSLPIGAVSPASYEYHTEVIGNIYENPELLK